MFLLNTILRRSIVLALVACTLSPMSAYALGGRRAAKKAAKAATKAAYLGPALAPYLTPASLAAGTGSADLMLVDAKLVAPATALAGPAYAVQITNQGSAAAARFVIAAVASADGKYREDAPKAMIELPGLAAGQTKEVTLRLPRGESQYLILAVDANGSVNESNKTNNTAVVETSAL